jgi:3-oxoacyl-[acyl-carrier-protein] synthase-3
VIAVRNGRAARARLAAVGAYAPERVVTNDEMSRRVETSDEWIVTRTGIRERRFAAEDETAGDMAVRAAERTLAAAGLDAAELDVLIVPTATPDAMFPATAVTVAHRIGATRAAAFDMSAACTGFVYGLAQASALVESGLAGSVLVVGSEVLSRVTDQADRATCILFADGAGAALVCAGDPGAHTGFLGFDLGADGAGADDLTLAVTGARESEPGGPRPAPGCIRMDGAAVFRFATRVMVESSERLLQALEMSVDDIDLVVAHQANSRILSLAAERLGIPHERLYNTLERYGNTSSASIPMALAEAREAGALRPGALLLLVGFGGGLTWGSTVVRYEPLGAEVSA